MNSSSSANPKPGDLFKLQILPGEFAFGRVMLNIRTQCIDPEKIDQESMLNGYENILLLELYRETTSGDLPSVRTPLIPGIFTGETFVKKGIWENAGFDAVDPRNVSFPEGLALEGAFKAAWISGELKHVFDFPGEKVEDLGLYPRSVAGIVFPEIILFQLGRKSEIKNPALINPEIRNLATMDLRFSPHRQQLFDLMGEEPNLSYYDRAKAKGFDLARFY